METLLSTILSKKLFTILDEASYLSLFLASKIIQAKNKKKIIFHDLVCCCFLHNYKNYRKFYKLNYHQSCKNERQAFNRDHDKCLALISYQKFEKFAFKMEMESQELFLEDLFEESIKKNKMKVFKYLAKNIGDKKNRKICELIASKGNLAMLKFAHKNSYVWDHGTIYATVRSGHLDCLKYAHENGCIYSRTALYYCKKVSSEIQSYLIQHNMQNMNAPNEKRRRKYRLNQTSYNIEVNINNQPMIVNVTKINL
jgi:hypothetical protein